MIISNSNWYWSNRYEFLPCPIFNIFNFNLRFYDPDSGDIEIGSSNLNLKSVSQSILQQLKFYFVIFYRLTLVIYIVN